MEISKGCKAPEFTLPDQNGAKHALHDYAGKWVLLYFYPKDNTPGCTTEACAIRDSFAEFKRRNAVVLGVSTDSVLSHKRFEEKHELPFTLLSDDKKTLAKEYGAWGSKSFMGRAFLGTKRMSFLIDPNGNIAKVYEEVKPADHAAEVLSDIEALSKA